MDEKMKGTEQKRKNKDKKAVRAIILTILILIFIGIPALFLYLIGSLGLFPIYLLKTYPYLAIGTILTLILMCGWLGKKGRIIVGIAFLCLCIGCGAYIGAGIYNDSISQIDDRDFMLREYEPFAENTKAVSLEEESTLKFTEEQILRLDGATALYPVYSGFVQSVYPEKEYKMYDPADDPNGDGHGRVTCTNTVYAYERLVEGKTDIIFCAAPSEAQLEMAEAAGMQLHMTPIGKEAFVFFVNKLNPVEELTVEEIQGIYSGEITNWKAVGGKMQKIRAFQRAENSGSQSALQRLMDGKNLMEPREEDRIDGMGGIITEVAAYRNYKNALGFSFRYYAAQMDTNDSIKLLALNGVAPTKETIRDSSYPISSSFYAITASPIGEPAPEETNADMAAFIDWILSPQGQAIVEQTGYVSIE